MRFLLENIFEKCNLIEIILINSDRLIRYKFILFLIKNSYQLFKKISYE